ncbi:MAG: HEAT repeat domain-containing protein [Candidatus Micrarchaeia archaeon]
MITKKEVLELIQQGKTNELVKLGSRAVKPMISLLSHSSIKVRNGCIEALAEIAKTDENTLQRLIQELKTNKKCKTRIGCADVLGFIRDSRVAEPLIKELKTSRDWLVGRSCAISLSRIIDPKAVKVLIEGLKDEDSDVRKPCAAALGIIGDITAVDFLILGLTDNNVNHPFAHALENINDPRGLAFKKVIYDKDKDYALKIGIEKTRATIKEYLELIKNHYSKERIGEIKVELYIFYRKVFEKATDLKPCMKLPELKIKPPKRGPEICARLMTVRV